MATRKKTTLSDVIAGAAQVPARDIGLRSAQELAQQDAEEFYEEGAGASKRRFPLPSQADAKAAGAALVGVAAISGHPIAAAAVFGAGCIAVSMLEKEGIK